MPWVQFVLGLFQNLSGLQILFSACACIGGVLLAIRLVLALFTGGGDDLEPGMDMTDDVDFIGDSDATFTIISLQSIVGFLLMFGLTGLSTSIQLESSNVVAGISAGCAGLFTMVIIAWITFAMRKLDRPGNIRIANAIGQTGTVYLTIPEDGIGRVQINVQERLRMFDAIAKDKSKIETEKRVRVVEIVDGNVLVVEKV